MISTDVLEGTTERQDCDICGGANTVTVSKAGGNILWFCHRATCSNKGVIRNQFTIDDIVPRKVPERQVPVERFIHPYMYDKIYAWLKDNNMRDFYYHNSTTIMYDPKLDRLVFLIKNKDGEIIDAVGKDIGPNTRLTKPPPKWHRYGNTGLPFVARPGSAEAHIDIAVVVEDAISACCIQNTFVDGVALLGTNLTMETLYLLGSYGRVYIALDRDALEKAWDIAKEVGQVTNASILVIEKDLKYYSHDELDKLLGGL